MSNIPLTDLRLGNIIKPTTFQSPKVVTGILPKLGIEVENAFTVFEQFIEGVPISEEWLERTNIKDIIPEYNNAVISLEETDNGYLFELDIPRAGFYKISREMKYLHDLQNVVKEVFGIELTLKQ